MVKYRTIENAKKEAIEQGIEQGLEQRIEQNVKSNIINMLKKNLDIDLISEITGKSIDYINDLKKEIE